MKDNLIIYVSSRNNYDMLEGEVLKNINREGFEIINIDDKSCNEEIAKGKAICKKHDIIFLENKSRGVQMATQTLIDYVNENRPNCKWIICFQHDHWPVSSNFFTTISKRIDSNKIDEYGIIGFNVLDNGDYTGESWNSFNQGNKPLGMIGMAHLSIHDRSTRWLCPNKQSKLLQLDKWRTPFIVEFPMWASVGINIKNWNTHIQPTTDYHFHLWLPDIAMQFNYKNIPCLILPDLYTFNDNKIKSKYGINHNSASGAQQGDEYHFGKYSNFDAWIHRWGWHYENPWTSFNDIQENYKGTLIYDFYNHDITKGPLKNINIEE